MANKRNKKRQQRTRRPGAPGQPSPAPQLTEASASALAGAVTTAAAVPAARPAAPGSRYSSTVGGPRRGAAAATTGTIDIDERVPYFAKDLRRIVITATVMVVIIVGASLLLR